MVVNWIWANNVRPLMDVLAWLTSYDLTEDEWNVIAEGVDESDGDAKPPREFEWELSGRERVVLRLAADPGTNVIQVKIEAPNTIEQKVDIALNLMNQFHFRRDDDLDRVRQR